jgi:Tol biopolymer transport system component
VVRRALEKNPHDRFQTAADLAFALENTVGGAATTFATAIPPAAAERRPVRSRRLVTGIAVLAAAALLIALGVGAARWLWSRPTPITYRQLTFQRGFISAARFAPDGHTILYSASWGDEPMRVYSARSDAMESQPLSVPNAKLLAATMPGEMAILVRPYEMATWIARGTLARAPVLGGTPRLIAEDVTDADVTADGAKFALIRQTGAYFRLEFPTGTVLYESSGYLSNPRISPGGDRVAFFEHPAFPDDRGFVVVVENGKGRRLTDEWPTLQGLAWTPDGGELWFGAANEADRSIYAVDLSGRRRIVWNGPTSLIIQDIARDGRVLAGQETNRYEIAGRQAGDPRDRGLNDFSLEGVRALARDGSALVSELYGVSGGQDYATYLKKFDGSPAIRLGTGSPEDMSPDGRWVATRLFSAPDRLVLLPTGAGDTRVLQLGKVRVAGTDALQARWTADGRHILFIGTEDGRSLATYRIAVEGGPPQAVTPAGVMGTLLSPDGRRLVVRDASKGLWSVMPLGSHPGSATPIRGLERAEAPIQWTSDGRGLFVFERGRLPSSIVRLDPATGARTVWKELAVPDAAGTGGLINVCITPDGGTYVFSYQRILVLLYLVSGLR